jgi:hypothetical protein
LEGKKITKSPKEGRNLPDWYLPGTFRSFLVRESGAWRHDSSGRAPAYQAQDPKFKPQYQKKKTQDSSQRVCLEEVKPSTLSEEWGGVRSAQMGGKAFQGGRNSLCRGSRQESQSPAPC